MTENIMFLHPNQIDDATLSGGIWESAAPLTEIQDRILGRRARSTSLSTSDTKVDIDLDRSVQIKGIGVIGHNIRPEAQWRIEAFSDNGRTTRIYDSGFQRAWVSPTSNLNERWDADDYVQSVPEANEVNDINWPLVHTILAGQDAQYWTITFDDPNNSDGYIEVGRIMIGYGWQAPINFVEGAGEGWQDDSEIVEAFSGTEFFREKKPFRRFTGSLDVMEKDPAFGRVQELIRRAKRTKEVFVIPQPDDPTHLNRRSFLARMNSLSTLERQLPDFSSQSFELKELR